MELLVEVVGYKAFKGQIRDSKIDNGELYALVELDTRYNKIEPDGTNWKAGFTVESWKVPSADIVLKLASLPAPSVKNPIPCRLFIKRISNGSESREVITDIEPLTVNAKTGELKAVPPVKEKAAA